MDPLQLWKTMILDEHAQSERTRAALPPDPPAGRDHWRDFAHMFRSDPHRTDDVILNRLLQDVKPHQTIIDVGAGGGRMALPLALHCRQVVAVEPSPSMGEVLQQQAAEHGIGNVRLVPSTWEDAEVDPAELVLCCNVLYTIQEIGPFVRKMEASAREKVLVVLYNAPPQSRLYPLWKEIHGEERVPLPSLPEFEKVLEELGIAATVDRLPPQSVRGFDTMEQAVQQVSQRLYLPEGDEKRSRLAAILEQRLEDNDGVLRISGDVPLIPAVVSWQPGQG